VPRKLWFADASIQIYAPSSGGRADIGCHTYFTEPLDETYGDQGHYAEVGRQRHQEPEHGVYEHADAEEILGAILLRQYPERYLRYHVAVEKRTEHVALLRRAPQERSFVGHALREKKPPIIRRASISQVPFLNFKFSRGRLVSPPLCPSMILRLNCFLITFRGLALTLCLPNRQRPTRNYFRLKSILPNRKNGFHYRPSSIHVP